MIKQANEQRRKKQQEMKMEKIKFEKDDRLRRLFFNGI